MRINILNYLKDNQLIMKIKKEKYEIKRGLFYIRTIIEEEGEGRERGERGGNKLFIRSFSLYSNPNLNNNSNSNNSIQIRSSSGLTEKISSYFQFFKRTILGDSKEIGTLLFKSGESQSLKDDWFAKGKVPVHYRSKIILITIHMWILNRKLILTKDTINQFTKTQEALFDRFWEYTIPLLKSLKLYSTEKGLQQTQLFSFHICQLLDEAILLEDEEKILDSIGGILWNYLFNRQDIPEDHIMELAKYTYEQYLHIISLDNSEFLVGNFQWKEVPKFKNISQRIRAGHGRESRKWPEIYNEGDKKETL